MPNKREIKAIETAFERTDDSSYPYDEEYSEEFKDLRDEQTRHLADALNSFKE